MADTPVVHFIIEALGELQEIEKKLAQLPDDDDSDRLVLISIRDELRLMVKANLV